MAIRTFPVLLVLIAALTTIPGAVAAQTTTGTISGAITDASGNALSGVEVRIESPQLLIPRTVTTGNRGEYVVPLLAAGTYTLTFRLAPFRPHSVTVALAPAQELPVDTSLGLQVSESVMVTAPVVSLAPRSVPAMITFSASLLSTLPTNRDLASALTLAPAVTGSGGISGAMASNSLATVDGATVNETLRGQSLALFVEDAIQEISVATSGISAEHGRFGGGITSVITRSGGDRFAGSLRDTLYNDRWRTLTPHPLDVRTDDVVSTIEATTGGPMRRRRLWFFLAGRYQHIESQRLMAFTNVLVPARDTTWRYEGKLKYAATRDHAVQFTYTGIRQRQENQSFSTAIDLNSVYDRDIPQHLAAITYTGVLRPQLYLEAQYSARRFAIKGEGARARDPIFGTLLFDRQRGNRRYWSPTFCASCGADERGNNDVFVKGAYSAYGGSHYFVFGYNGFNDMRRYDNHQSGSDYLVLGTTSIIRDGVVYPVWLADGSTLIQYRPVLTESHGTNFRTHGLFVNDRWTLGSHYALSLGARIDKNHGRDSSGQLVAMDARVSPRLGMVWDPNGRGAWAVNASVGRYVSALANNVADLASAAGRPAAFQWVYGGPSVNANGAEPLVSADAALRQLFSWFEAGGGVTRPFVGASVPGVSVRIPGSLVSPVVTEYAAGVSRTLGGRGSVRIDVVRRRYGDFPYVRTDRDTGVATDAVGNRLDRSFIENTNVLRRRYAAMVVNSTLHPRAGIELGANYTLSRTSGNFEGEDANGPYATNALQYPEYKHPAWTTPDGRLNGDQRHRINAWATSSVPHVRSLTIGATGRAWSGAPYGAVGLVDARPYVPNPGYVTPQGGTAELYYYTARDAFETDWLLRVDLSLNYSRFVSLAAHRVELYAQTQIWNVFNHFSIVNPGALDLTVLDPVVSARYERFDPFTTTPIEGVHWARSAGFGQPLSPFAYSVARAFSFSLGARF
jgi:hypothetical protein